MKIFIYAAAIIALITAPVDDPTPSPTPGYQTPSRNGPALRGQQLPAICAEFMWTCDYTWSPDDGTWHQKGGG